MSMEPITNGTAHLSKATRLGAFGLLMLSIGLILPEFFSPAVQHMSALHFVRGFLVGLGGVMVVHMAYVKARSRR